jgi:excisionase family DNA binding protein
VSTSRNRAPAREFLTTAEAAAEAGVHVVTVRRMIMSGELPAYRVGTRGALRIDRRDVDGILIRNYRPGRTS